MPNHPTYEIISYYDDVVLPENTHMSEYSGITYSCWYVRTGSVTVKTNYQTLTASRGEWVFIEPLTKKTHHFFDNAHIISIRFNAFWNGLHFFPPLRTPWSVPGEDVPQLQPAAENLCKFTNAESPKDRQRTPAESARQTALFSDWLWQWLELRERQADNTSPPMDERVSRIIERLLQSAGIGAIDYPALGKVSGLSRAQINRIFKQSTGLTPKEWKDLECQRIAERMMRAGQLSVKEIAAQLNFSDASYFTKWFRARTNKTPSQWIRMHERRLSI